jgi:hypothetical protein
MDPVFLRSKAARCRYLADIATNREIRHALDALAQELEEQATALEAHGEAGGAKADGTHDPTT